jgi:hypothetical protein
MSKSFTYNLNNIGAFNPLLTINDFVKTNTLLNGNPLSDYTITSNYIDGEIEPIHTIKSILEKAKSSKRYIRSRDKKIVITFTPKRKANVPKINSNIKPDPSMFFDYDPTPINFTFEFTNKAEFIKFAIKQFALDRLHDAALSRFKKMNKNKTFKEYLSKYRSDMYDIVLRIWYSINPDELVYLNDVYDFLVKVLNVTPSSANDYRQMTRNINTRIDELKQYLNNSEMEDNVIKYEIEQITNKWTSFQSKHAITNSAMINGLFNAYLTNPTTLTDNASCIKSVCKPVMTCTDAIDGGNAIATLYDALAKNIPIAKICRETNYIFLFDENNWARVTVTSELEKERPTGKVNFQITTNFNNLRAGPSVGQPELIDLTNTPNDVRITNGNLMNSVIDHYKSTGNANLNETQFIMKMCGDMIQTLNTFLRNSSIPTEWVNPADKQYNKYTSFAIAATDRMSSAIAIELLNTKYNTGNNKEAAVIVTYGGGVVKILKCNVIPFGTVVVAGVQTKTAGGRCGRLDNNWDDGDDFDNNLDYDIPSLLGKRTNAVDDASSNDSGAGPYCGDACDISASSNAGDLRAADVNPDYTPNANHDRDMRAEARAAASEAREAREKYFEENPSKEATPLTEDAAAATDADNDAAAADADAAAADAADPYNVGLINDLWAHAAALLARAAALWQKAIVYAPNNKRQKKGGGETIIQIPPNINMVKITNMEFLSFSIITDVEKIKDHQQNFDNFLSFLTTKNITNTPNETMIFKTSNNESYEFYTYTLQYMLFIFSKIPNITHLPPDSKSDSNSISNSKSDSISNSISNSNSISKSDFNSISISNSINGGKKIHEISRNKNTKKRKNTKKYKKGSMNKTKKVNKIYKKTQKYVSRNKTRKVNKIYK